MGEPECSRVETPTEVPPLRLTRRDLGALKEQVVQRSLDRDGTIEVGFEGISSGEEEAVKPLRASFDLRQEQIGGEWIEDKMGAQPGISKRLSIEVESLPNTPARIVAEKAIEDFSIDADSQIGAFREPGGEPRPGEGEFIAIDRGFDADREALETCGEMEITEHSGREPSLSQAISRLPAIEIGDDVEPRPIESFTLQSQFHSLRAYLRVTAVSTIVIESGEFDLAAEVETWNAVRTEESQSFGGVKAPPGGDFRQGAGIGIDPILIPFVEERVVGGHLVVADLVKLQECRLWDRSREGDVLRGHRLETGGHRRQDREESGNGDLAPTDPSQPRSTATGS